MLKTFVTHLFFDDFTHVLIQVWFSIERAEGVGGHATVQASSCTKQLLTAKIFRPFSELLFLTETKVIFFSRVFIHVFMCLHTVYSVKGLTVILYIKFYLDIYVILCIMNLKKHVQ